MEPRPSCCSSGDVDAGSHDAHQNVNNGKLISTSLATKLRMIELRQAVILRSYTRAHGTSGICH